MAPVPAEIVFTVIVPVFVDEIFVFVKSRLPTLSAPSVTPLPGSVLVTMTAPAPVMPVLISRFAVLVLNGVAVLPIAVPAVIKETVLPVA